MKAWLVRPKNEFSSTIIFAETRGKARNLAQYTDACEDTAFCDIEVHRVPEADKYYSEGKTELSWYNLNDRYILVKEFGFRCEYIEPDVCDDCPAKQFCDAYEEWSEEF